MDDEISYKGYTIQVVPDDDPENPRAWDNLGTMVCFHRRYTLGDKTDYRERDFSSWAELSYKIYHQEDALECLPITMMDHSGLTLRCCNGFSDVDPMRWDWGMIGYIFISKDKVRKEYGVKHISQQLRSRVRDYLMAEVKTYSHYLENDVWGFKVLDAQGQLVDSCWSFYDAAACLADARSTVDGYT